MDTRRWAALVASAGLLAVFVAVAAGAGTVDPSFAPGDAIGAGKVTAFAAVADVNGDGNADLATANPVSNDVTILLGNGSGSFSQAASSPVKAGEQPVWIVTADLNGDGKADLVVANDRSKDVTVLLGDGAGGFSAAAGSPVSLTGSPGRLAAADLNGDAKIDLAVSVYENRRWRVTILLGDGSGRFAPPGPPVALRGASGWDSLVVADVNGDGKPDLAVANSELKGISILLGNGVGGFGDAGNVETRHLPGSLAVADLNRDGRLDLVSASQYADDVGVFLGTGEGAFRPAPRSRITVPGHPHNVATADFNGDRQADLAVESDSASTVTVLLGNGAGAFRPAAFSPFPTPAPSLIAGAVDLNGDGKPDLLLTMPLSGLRVLFQTQATPVVARGRVLRGRPDVVFSTRGRLITKLAADGVRVAAMTALSNGACGRVVVWTPPGRTATSFRTSGCSRSCARRPRTSLCTPIVCRFGTGCVDELAVGGGRVAWIVRAGGNSLELTVMAVKLSGGAARKIDSAIQPEGGAGGDPNGGHFGQLLGGGPLLAYNSWLVCFQTGSEIPRSCPPLDPATGLAEEKLIRVSAGRRVVVKRGAGSYRLAAVGGGRMAVETAGTVSVLAPSGVRLATVPAVKDNPPRAVALSTTSLAVTRTFTLHLYNPATGAEAKSLPLGPAAALQLVGVNSKLALLRGTHRLVLVRLSDGKLISLALPGGAASVVDSTLTAAGLFYAYNVLRPSAKGRIVFEPTAKLLARY